MRNSAVYARAKRPGREVDRTLHLFLQVYIHFLIPLHDSALVHSGNYPLLAAYPI